MTRLGVWRRLSLRARLVTLGTAGLAVALCFGGVLLIEVLDRVVQRSVEAEARRTGQDVARLVNENALPQPAPVAGGQLVQVVDANHRVRSASVDADRLVPLLRESEIPRARAGTLRYVPGERAGLTGPLRVVVVPAGPTHDPQLVIVARPVGDVRHGVDVVRVALIVVYPLFVVGMALAGWRVAGAVLRPVEALRAGAERIAAASASQRQHPSRGDDESPPPDRLPLPPSHDEIHRLAVTLNRMLDRLAAARDRQRAFVADAAHELRSPLASMRTQIEVAQRLDERARVGGPGAASAADGEGDPGRSHDEEPVNELLTDLLVDVDRLARLVNDLLTLARADESPPPIRTGSVDLTELAGEVVARFRQARVPVTIVSAEPLWTRGDRDALARVLTNLLDNAVRHARGRVIVAAGTSDAGEAVVSVIDDGPGVPPADRERVFDRFTRLDDARSREDGGTGLGLAIVRELLRSHGGTITLADAVSGESGAGLRAEVRLPATDPHGLTL